jgi:hypothetical protein
MQANQLRIGNWVMIDPHNFPQQVCDVMCDCVNTENVQGAHYGLMDAIPLTEEWLLKFGFTRHHDDYYNDIIFIKNVVNNYEFEWGVYPITLNSGVQINNRTLLKHVHQLQNLYFALTGEELTYGGNNEQ